MGALSYEMKKHASKLAFGYRHNTRNFEDAQHIYLEMGKSGCLFLCLLFIAEMYTGGSFSPVSVAKKAILNGWMKTDFYINDALAILKYLTGVSWVRSIKTPGKVDFKEITYNIIEQWEKEDGITHFTPALCDILEDSQTVKHGKLTQFYIFEPK